MLALLGANDDALRAAAASAAGAWKLRESVGKLEALAGSVATVDGVRQPAVDALAEIGGVDARAALDRLAAPGSPKPARRAAVGALANVDPKSAAARAADWLVAADDPAAAEELVGRFVRLKNGPEALAAALAGKTLHADVAKLALRAARATGRDDADLLRALRRAAGLGDAPAPLSEAEKQRVLAAVVSRGDATRGEVVFRRKESQCLKCHAIAGAGGQVGPSLESVGASAPIDYLLDSLLEPNKAVKENYHALVVATNDGRVVTGVKLRQTDAELVLRDAEDREVSIPVSSIDEQKTGGSLMPTGLVEPLTRGELVDLVRFLSELGKIGPYSVSKARLLRRWQVLEPTNEAYTDLRRWGLQSIARSGGRDPRGDGYGSGGNALTWSPAYSRVSGELPLDDLPRIALGPLPGSGAGVGPTGFARARIDVSTPGRVRLALNSTAGLSVWVDGTAVEPKDVLDLDLTAGLHDLTFAVRLAARTVGLRCTLDDVPGSPARAQPVVGK